MKNTSKMKVMDTLKNSGGEYKAGDPVIINSAGDDFDGQKAVVIRYWDLQKAYTVFTDGGYIHSFDDDELILDETRINAFEPVHVKEKA